MEYRVSKYTYLFISSKGENLVYCSRTNAFCKVSKDLYSLLEQGAKDPSFILEIDPSSLKILIENKIIIQKGDDEDFLLKHQYETNIQTYLNSTLLLILVPSLDCNFKCHYCFEEHKRPQTMDDATIDSLITFINSRQNVKSCGICWYGGEPLLAFDIMKKIMKRIKEEVRLPIKRHSILTNGALINEDVISFFKEYEMNNIQITLDGSKERHDSIRKDKYTNAPTYDNLIKNIDYIVEELPDTNVDVRINIENKNKDDYYQAVKILGERWRKKKVNIYPGFLRMDNETKTALSCSSMQKNEIANFLFDMYQKGASNESIFPEFPKELCMAARTNAYVIGPSGEFYKCWNDVGNPQKVVGTIFSKQLTNPSLYYRYLVGTKWYNREKCRKCFFLPICENGCAWYVLRNQHENANFVLCNCMQKMPGMLNKCLESFYEQKYKTKI